MISFRAIIDFKKYLHTHSDNYINNKFFSWETDSNPGGFNLIRAFSGDIGQQIIQKIIDFSKSDIFIKYEQGIPNTTQMSLFPEISHDTTMKTYNRSTRVLSIDESMHNLVIDTAIEKAYPSVCPNCGTTLLLLESPQGEYILYNPSIDEDLDDNETAITNIYG